MKRQPTPAERLHNRVFNVMYGRSLVYNTCWEDPALDRAALNIATTDTMLVITSAGCNVLDYALAGPRRIHAVDANPRQTALLELKLAGIRRLDFDDFFALFGHGRSGRFEQMYHDVLRADLSPFAVSYWDRRIHWFAGSGWRRSFYFFGLSGLVARVAGALVEHHPRLRTSVDRLLLARSLPEQQEIYDREVVPQLWNRPMNWAVSRRTTMSLLGVPYPQAREVQDSHQHGIAGFIRTSIDYVFRQLPIWSNYFWTLYLRGAYTRECCPEYLKPANFAALKGGLADCIAPHTTTITGFLRASRERIDKLVLLDHMDWMSWYHPEALAEEWTAILDRAAPGARAIFRSAAPEPRFLDAVTLTSAGPNHRLMDHLAFDRPLAERLHRQDRVGTYASFHIADILPR